MDIFTIGHSNHPINKFIDLLNENQIKMIIDIRSVPYSRFNPQYNSNFLKSVLSNNSIDYLFLGKSLGGRINDPTCFINNEVPSQKTNLSKLFNYEIIVQKEWFNSGIQEILKVINSKICALLCSEENPDNCHRKVLVGRRLLDLGITIHHIRSKKCQDFKDDLLFY